jgi:hypothetical protein
MQLNFHGYNGHSGWLKWGPYHNMSSHAHTNLESQLRCQHASFEFYKKLFLL